MGLLDGNLDPQTMASLQLAGGLLSPGSFGQGLQRGISGYQGALAGAQDMQLRQQQILAAQQEQRIKDIQLQQQTRMFNLQTPFLEQAVARMQGQSPAGLAATPNTPDPASGLGATSAPQGQPVPQAQGQAPQQSGSMFPGLSDDVAFGVIGTGGFSKLPEAIMKANEPTDLVKTMRAAGIDPASGLGRQILQANIAKSNYIAPVNGRPGAILRDPVTQQPIAFNPHIPEGGTPVFDASGNVTAINPLQGATGVIQASEAAKAAGKAQFTPYAGFDGDGRPSAVTSVANVLDPSQPAPMRNNNPGALMPGGKLAQFKTPEAGIAALDGNLQSYGKSGVNTLAGVISKWAPPSENDTKAYINDVAQRTGIAPGQPIDLSNPMVRHVIGSAIMVHENGSSAVANAKGSGVFAAPPLGAATGSEFQQTDLGKRFASLRDQGSQAQTTNSYLENIKQLADTASTGQFSDRLKFVNSLLATAGVSDKALDAVTANNLLDKYSNQIVARLGQGGLGTDSARAILQSAYPNAHMTPQAIHEAADNLIGANKMTQAKLNLLAPLANSKDPVSYQQKEQAFDQNADPRIWQLKGMNPAQATAFLNAMPAAARADLQKRAQALKGMGAL